MTPALITARFEQRTDMNKTLVTLPPSAKECIILLAMIPGSEHTAGVLARRAWERPTKLYVVGPQQGQNQAMGAALARMQRKGLVNHYLSDTVQRRWYLTEAGKKARDACI